MVAEKNGAVELKAAKSSTQQQQHKRKIRNERNIYLTSFKHNKIYTKEFSISTKHFELHVNRNDDSVADFFRYSNAIRLSTVLWTPPSPATKDASKKM